MGILSIEFKDDLSTVKALAKELGYRVLQNDDNETLESLTQAMQTILLDEPFKRAYKNIASRNQEIIIEKVKLEALIDTKIEELKPMK